jgi:hypothetical protein
VTPDSDFKLRIWLLVLQEAAYILNFNDFTIQSQEDLEHAIQQTQLRKMMKAKLVIATDKSYGVHPMDGILQIHFDQLNIIAKHLEDIRKEQDAQRMDNLPNPTNATVRTNVAATSTDSPLAIPPEIPPEDTVAQTFTKKQLLKRDDWPEWQQGIHKQLNMYWNQGMFGNPMILPTNANALHML